MLQRTLRAQWRTTMSYGLNTTEQRQFSRHKLKVDPCPNQVIQWILYEVTERKGERKKGCQAFRSGAKALQREQR